MLASGWTLGKEEWPERPISLRIVVLTGQVADPEANLRSLSQLLHFQTFHGFMWYAHDTLVNT